MQVVSPDLRYEIVDEPVYVLSDWREHLGTKQHRPCYSDSRKPYAVSANDEPIRNLGALHRILLVPIRLIHAQPPDEDGKCGDDAQSKRPPPNGAEMVRPEAAWKSMVNVFSGA
jgi:hypothetical protein